MTSQDTVREWARTLFQSERNFYLLDTETTGLGPQDEVVQIGVLDKYGVTVLETLVKPTQPVHAGVIAIHGISNEMLADAPTFDEVYVRLSIVLAGQTLIAYNMDFDWRMLTQSAAKYGLPPFRVAQKECAMKRYAAFRGVASPKGGNKWFKLTEAARHHRIKVDKAHSAVGDCVMTLELMKVMAGLR